MDQIKSRKSDVVYERIFQGLMRLAGFFVIVIMAGILFTLIMESIPSIKAFGWTFVTRAVWDPVFGEFGILSFMVGTLLTSLLALVICIPISLALAIAMGELFKHGWLSHMFKSMIELLAGIPSIIYGFWGIFVLVPMIRDMQMALGIIPYGVGIFTASLILALMVIPYAASLGREVIQMVPEDLKEAALSLGATRFEVIRYVVLPYAKSGILSGIFLSFGRAVGETMAVTMVIGNTQGFPTSIFSPGNTMASVIANEFAEASEALYLSSLVNIGLVLFIVTAIISYFGRILIKKWSVNV